MAEKDKNQRLQETRKKEIPVTIEKYKKLIDGIFNEVQKEFPTFKDITIKDDSENIIKSVTAEEQLYAYMLMREKAIDHADRMLNKINLLELELNAPDLLIIDGEDGKLTSSTTRNYIKDQARKTK